MNSSGVAACELRNVSKRFGAREVLRDVSLSVADGESVAIVGPSGSGKSTLLSCILGLVLPDAGEVFVGGRSMSALNRSQRAQLRGSAIGMVFQFAELLGELTAAENVALPGQLARTPGARDRALGLLNELGLPNSQTLAEDLSGGERQRVAIARALVTRPALVLADEPTGALDASNRDSAAQLLFDFVRHHGSALVVVSHDPAIARLANRTYELMDGALWTT